MGLYSVQFRNKFSQIIEVDVWADGSWAAERKVARDNPGCTIIDTELLCAA